MLRAIADRLTDQFDGRKLHGTDWFQLSSAEQDVFQIDPARFPRLVAAWQLYEVFIKIVDAEDYGLDDAPFENVRRHRPDLYEEAVVDEMKFQKFATEFAGITQREATAMYHKHQFWQIRNGLTKYADET